VVPYKCLKLRYCLKVNRLCEEERDSSSVEFGEKITKLCGECDEWKR